MNFDEIKKLISLKNFNTASQKLNKILYTNPNQIEALYLTAIIQSTLKEYKEAIQLYEKLIKIQKNYIFFDNLGTIYLKLSNFSEAKKIFDSSLKINSRNAVTISKIGVCLAMQNLENLAIDNFKNSLKIEPGLLDAIYNLLDIYEKTNRKTELIFLINEKIKIYPSNQILIFYKSFDYEAKKNLKTAIISLQNLNLKKANLNIQAEKQWEIKIYFRLGYLFNKLKNYNNAFLNYSQGNKLTLKTIENKYISNNIFNNNLKKCLKYSTKILPDKNLKNISNYKLIFHIGFPRSGTTLIDAILSSHSQIKVMEEIPIVDEIFETQKFNILDNISSKNQKSFNEYYEKELLKNTKGLKLQNKIIIDKLPLNLIWIRHLALIFPNAKFILSIRHPLDCLLSCYFQNFVLNSAMINFLELNKAAEIYNYCMQIILNNKLNLSNQLFILKYEDLILDFKNNINNLLNFMELSWEENINNYKQNAIDKDRIRTPSYNQVIKPIYHSSVNKWVNYKEQLKPIIPIIENWMKYFDYKY